MIGIDWEYSSMGWKLKNGSVGKFRIESICAVSSKTKDQREVYLLSPPVLACDVYASGPLIYQPPYMYQLLLSKQELYKIFRTHVLDIDQDSHGNITSLAETPIVTIINKEYHTLNSTEALIDKANGETSLHASLCYENQDSIIELSFPVKHLNIHPENKNFQIETGPVCIPADEDTFNLNAVSIAYLAFNDWHSFEFAPFRSEKIDKEKKVRFYGNTIRKSAQIKILHA